VSGACFFSPARRNFASPDARGQVFRRCTFGFPHFQKRDNLGSTLFPRSAQICDSRFLVRLENARRASTCRAYFTGKFQLLCQLGEFRRLIFGERGVDVLRRNFPLRVERDAHVHATRATRGFTTSRICASISSSSRAA